MKDVIKDAEGKLSSIMEKMSGAALKEGQETNFETKLCDCSQSENGVKHPDIDSKFFNSTTYEKDLWEDNKIFVGFALLVALSAFVFCNCFGFLNDNGFLSSHLLFFFGVIAILFVGLVVVALFMIKASAKHREEKNERKNKMLAFRLRMLETAFDLENRKIIAEKLCIEKSLSLKEKECLYSLDEKQRESEHNRKIQLKQFEILEDYMKHLAELAKTGQQNTWNIDLLQIFGFITKEDQPAQNDDVKKGKPTASGGELDDDSDKNTQEQQAASIKTEEEPSQEEATAASSEEKPDAESPLTEVKPKD